MAFVNTDDRDTGTDGLFGMDFLHVVVSLS
jgi:hypothetical protein